MIAEVAARVPDSLSAYRGGVAAGPGGEGARPLSSLRDPRVFDATLEAFGAGLGGNIGSADRCALVSYWSQFYLAALATPALTALVRLGRPLPLAFDAMSLELDEAGRPYRFLVTPERLRTDRGAPGGLSGLVGEHLRPFVELCRVHCGIAPRVLWGNAAVVFDYVASQLGEDAGPACAEVATCLGRSGGQACALSPLARALRPGASECRRRRVCCLRQQLPGVPSCGALCPLDCEGRP